MTQPVQTPLGINSLSGLLQNTGLVPNVPWSTQIGSSSGIANYTPGTWVNNVPALPTLLSVLSSAAALIGNAPINEISATTFSSLLNMGTALPALALSGGTNDYLLTSSTTTGAGVVTVPSTQTLVVNGAVYFSGTLDPVILANTIYYVKSITSSTQFTISATPGGATLALTGGAYAMNVFSVDWYSTGWMGRLAQQANATWTGLPVFLADFSQATSFINQQNPVIWSTSNSPQFLDGVFSNMNDLITADVSGVCLSLPQFGQDLIAQGRSIDLSTIQSFGLPSNLLQTLRVNRAQTDAVNIALIAAGLSTTEIQNFTKAPSEINQRQQQQIYQAFQYIVGDDLDEVCLLLNCRLTGLDTLADLLNPRKLFPLSYAALTVPLWNTEAGPTNSKTYYPIYVDNGVSTLLSGNAVREQVGYITPENLSPAALYDPTSPEFRELVPGFDSYLRDILPVDIATACGAFSYSMQQISNIRNMDVQKFAQVVANLETTRDLPLTGGTNVPVDTSAAQTALASLALGTGPNGTYTMADLFGSITGTNYTLPDLSSINTANLQAIYAAMLSVLTAPPTVAGYNVDLAPLIVQANAEITALSLINSIKTTEINTQWNNSVNSLTKLIGARIRAFRDFNAAEIATTPDTQISWINQLQTWAIQTDPNQAAQTIEQLCDNTVSGQSIVAVMRQLRNESRLNLLGISTNAYIPGEPTRAERSQLIANNPANTAAEPIGQLVGDKYSITDGQYESPRVAPDGSAVDGSFGGSPYTELIPPELNTLYTSAQLRPSTYSVEQARTEVEKCNCDCWQP